MKTQNNITVSSTKVILNICLFIAVYILLIILGALILWGTAHAAFFILSMIFSIRLSTTTVILLMVGLGLLGFGIMFGLYLIKFLFTRIKNENPERVEISQSNYPELFKTIKEVADATYCSMPKKVFLSPDVNACVFYNASFWNIFFPVRKNLEIGMGLMNSLSIDEFRGILAHEFGHFSQKSMKIGSFVYVTNTVLYNLAYQNDAWDEWVIKWSNVGSVFGLFGSLTYLFTNQVKRLLQFLYRIVNKSNMHLSRQMEYDADNVAGKYIGAKVFSSALRKIEFTGFTYETTKNTLVSLYGDNKNIEDIYPAHSYISLFLAEKNNVEYSAEKLIIEDFKTDSYPSRLAVDDAWSTHPSTESRIKEIEGIEGIAPNDRRIALELIENQEIKFIMSEIIYSSLGIEKNDNVYPINNEDFKIWLNELYAKDRIDEKYDAYLNREIFIFNIDETLKDTLADVNPINETNTTIFKEYQTAVNDLNTLYAVKNKQMEVTSITYQGVLCSKKNLPIDLHQKYVEDLQRKIEAIDKQVFSYLTSKILEENKKNRIITIYNNLFYISSLLENGETIVNNIRNIVYQLQITLQWSEESLNILLKDIRGTENLLKVLIKDINWKALDTFTDNEAKENLIKYGSDTPKTTMDSFNEEAFNELINHTNLCMNVLSETNHKYKIELSTFLQEIEEKV